MNVPNDALTLASRSDSLGPILPVATAEAMADAMKQYEALKRAVLGENDEQEITVKGKKRKFTKRSGWRRLSIAFGVSTTILDRTITTGPDGRTLSAEFTVRATAPNGRFADGWGACSAWEERFQDERGRGKMEHDIPATAETRAENRAASNLFGYGEISAEEIEDSPGVARPTCPNCGKPVRESTFNAGEWYCWAKQGGCGWKGSNPSMTEAGEIPTNQASAATQAALREAEATTPPQSPPSQGVPGEGTSPVPPAAEVKSGAGDMVATPPAPQSSGPRAKRHNVVKAPTAPQGAPSAAATVPASPAAVSAPPVSLVDPALDGRAEYLDSLRQQAREVAAQLQHVTVKWRNAVKNREEIALGRLAPDPEVPERPNPGADAALNAYLKQFYGDDSLTLADIDEDRLASDDVKVGLIASLEHARKSVAKRLKDGK